MRFLSRLPLLITPLFLLLLTACASMKYNSDFKSGTNFTEIKTYSWRAVTINIAGADKLGLQNLIDQQLQAQGLQLVKEKADVLVDLQVISRVSRGGNTSIGIGLGLPIGRHGSVGLGTGQTLGKGKQEGVMIVDFTDQATNTLVWRGNAEAIPLIYFSLKSEPKIREVVQKLLMQFPPK